MRKDQAENIIKIVKCLKQAEEGWLWIREISRRTGLHHKTVSRLVDKHLTMFVDMQSMEPFNVRMIKLKANTDISGVFKFLSIMEKIENKPK
jgi:hypothetical protein